MAQRVRDKLWRQASFGRGPGEVLLVAAADDELVLAPLVEVAVAGRAVVGDVLVDSVGDVLRYRDVPVVALLAELQRAEPGLLVDLLADAQDGAAGDPAAHVDGERFGDAQPAPVHQPYGGRPV